MSTLWPDLRFAFRQLLKSPGFTLVVIVSLADGIGANAVVFTWIRATLLNAIPLAAQPAELAVLMPKHKSGGLTDTMSLVVPLLLFAAALATSWFPARRASRVDPIVALRTE